MHFILYKVELRQVGRPLVRREEVQQVVRWSGGSLAPVPRALVNQGNQLARFLDQARPRTEFNESGPYYTYMRIHSNGESL